MLVLTRRVGETLLMGNDITVTVLEVKRNQVRIGIKAPKEVSVHRSEIYQRIQQEKLSELAPEQPHSKLLAKRLNHETVKIWTPVSLKF